MQALSGWFGFRDRIFELRTGVVKLEGNKNEPQILLRGETMLRSKLGELMLVSLEASGTMSSPKIILSSDTGLTQQEILKALASGGSSRNITEVNSPSELFETKGYSPLEDIPILSFSSFLNDLTRVNTFTLEPRYNYQTGAIEPVILVRKRLSPKLSIFGDGIIASTFTQTRGGVIYELDRDISITGYTDTSSLRNQTSVGSDVTLTVLAQEKPKVNISIEGNYLFSKSKILQILKLTPRSIILPAAVPSLKNLIDGYYRQQGYKGSVAYIQCNEKNGICSDIKIYVKEAPARVIQNIIIETDSLSGKVPYFILDKISKTSLIGKISTIQLLKQLKQDLQEKLYENEYLDSSVITAFRDFADESASIVIKLDNRGKTDIKVTGAKFFSNDDLEAIIKKKISGSSSIGLKGTDILKEKYIKNGFIGVAVEADEQKDDIRKITFSVREGLQSIIKECSVEIKDAVYDEELVCKKLLDKPINEEALATVSDKISEDLVKIGYKSPVIEGKVLPIESSEYLKAKVIINIDPKDRFCFNKINISKLPEKIKFQNPKTEGIIYENKVNEIKQNILAMLQDEGYLLATVQADYASTLNKDCDNEINLNVEINNRTLISDIYISGLEKISNNLVYQVLGLKNHTPWKASLISEAKRSLLKLGLFTRVEILPKDGILDSDSEDMEVKLEERTLQTLDVGGGYDSVRGVHAFGEATEREFFSDGRLLSARLDGYFNSLDGQVNEGIASMRYLNPSFLNTPFSHIEDISFQKINTSSYEFDIEKIALASYFHRLTNDSDTFTLGHTLEKDSLSSVPDDVIFSKFDKGSSNYSFLFARSSIDRRDDPLLPSKGYALGLEYKLASDLIGSDYAFQAIQGNGSFLIKLNNRLTFASMSKAGAIRDINENATIPVNLRYYLGGRSSIRGFSENSLGSRGSLGSVIGGNTFASENLELQLKVLDSFALHTFFDAGDVYFAGDSFNLRTSTGVGLRYLSPIGPVGVDVGFPLERQDGEDAWRLHVVVGSSF